MGGTIDSRQVAVADGTTRSAPPRPVAAMDAASCTSTLTESAHDAGASKPSSDARSGGQSGRLDAFSSITIRRSPSRTATLTNFADSDRKSVVEGKRGDLGGRRII